MKDFEQQRGNNLQELEKLCAENSALKAQIDNISEENVALIEKHSFIQSKLDTLQKVTDEQIKKKNAFFEENKGLRSKLKMFETKIDHLAKQITQTNQSRSEENETELDSLKSQIDTFKTLTTQQEQEIKSLKSENDLLYKNIDALNASSHKEVDAVMLSDQDKQQLQQKEDKEVTHFQNMIEKCISKMLDSGSSTKSSENELQGIKDNVSQVFSDLKQSQAKCSSLQEELKSYKNSLYHAKKEYQLLKTSSSDIELYKQQLDDIIKSNNGKYFDDPDNNPIKGNKVLVKMWTLLKKSKRLFELTQTTANPDNPK